MWHMSIVLVLVLVTASGRVEEGVVVVFSLLSTLRTQASLQLQGTVMRLGNPLCATAHPQRQLGYDAESQEVT